MIRRLRAAMEAEREGGVTMVELLVAVVVTSVVLAAASALYLQTTRATSSGLRTRSATSTAAVDMGAIASAIRMTAPTTLSGSSTLGLVAGTANSLTIYSNVDSPSAAVRPTLVTFTLTGTGALVETRLTGVASGGYWSFVGTPTTTTLSPAGSLATGTATPLFAFTDSSGNALPASGTTLAAGDLANVASVTVTVTVANTNGVGGSDPVVLTNQVGMPNLAIANAGN